MTASPLRILQAAAWYGPDQVGGTEVYVEGLVSELARQGVVSEVVIPRPGPPRTYTHAGAQASTYTPGDIDSFAVLLSRAGEVIYHQHSWTPDCGLEHLRLARRGGLRTVITVHVPGVSCPRGTMMRLGRSQCDGRIEGRKCAACWSQGRGAPAAMGELLAAIPLTLSRRALKANHRVARAFAARALIEQRAHLLADMIAHADRVVAVCEWLYAALLANGVPRHKLVLSRQGVDRRWADDPAEPRPEKTVPLRLLFLGRWSPLKGLETVVRAVQALPAGLEVDLTIHNAAPGPAEEAYRTSVMAVIDGDRRIIVRPPLLRAELAGVLARSDVLLAPSIWLETGPLVVLEAQAAGVFVIGSALGGIAELVGANGGGRLVPAGDVTAWAAAIEDAAVRRRAGRLAEPRRVRTMADAASDMAALYSALD